MVVAAAFLLPVQRCNCDQGPTCSTSTFVFPLDPKQCNVKIIRSARRHIILCYNMFGKIVTPNISQWCVSLGNVRPLCCHSEQQYMQAPGIPTLELGLTLKFF